MPQIIEVSVTYDTEDIAQATATWIVKNRLAACVHVEGPFNSTYWWDGKMQHEPEWRLTAKSIPSSKEALIQAIEQDHPYDLPGILTTKADVDDSFAAWIAQEVKA